MKDTSREEFRCNVVTTCFFVGIAMAFLSLWIAFDKATELSLKTTVFLALFTGIPLGTSFYQSVGKESVGGLPCSGVVCLGSIISVIIELQYGWGWGFLALVIASFILIGVQCYCNKKCDY